MKATTAGIMMRALWRLLTHMGLQDTQEAREVRFWLDMHGD